MPPLVAACSVVYFTSTLMLYLVTNISFVPVTIPKRNVLADETALKIRRVNFKKLSALPNCGALVSPCDVSSARQRKCGRRFDEKRVQVTNV